MVSEIVWLLLRLMMTVYVSFAAALQDLTGL